MGKKLSIEHRKKLSISKLGNRNPMWKGKNAGLDAIHIWIRLRLPKPALCQNCNKVPPYDLANISQKYKRRLDDWLWLCRKCHMTIDGRLKKFLSLKRWTKPPIICKLCKELKKHYGHGYCSRCSDNLRYYTKRRTEQTVSKLNNVNFKQAVKLIGG